MQVLKLSILSIILAAAAAFGQGGSPDDMAVSVETVQVRTTNLDSSVKAIGTLIADASATLRAEIAGQVIAIHFEDGQALQKGAPLFSFESTVLEAEVNEARANASRSEAALTRARELFAKKLISADDYDTARANYDVDAARLRSSQAILSKMVIRAPFDGFAGLRRINIGDYANVGQELVDVVRLDLLRVDFSLPEILLAKIKTGLPVEITVDAYPGESFPGTVTAIAPKSDVAGHSIEVRARLPNSELKLRPGLFVRINVSLGNRADAIVIPEQAIWPVGRDKTVFVVVDGKAMQRVVALGVRQPGSVEIVSGLTPGETIVTAGQMKLFDGASVRSVGGSPSAANKR